MSQNKSTPKGAKKSRAELLRELARNIAAIFANPECPERIYDALADAMLEIHNRTSGKVLDESEDYQLAILNAYVETREKGGAR